MRQSLLILKLLVFAYLIYLLQILVFTYDATDPSFHPPVILFIVDWINLFIHEAGHFVFRIFGQWVYILGGSLMQILLPALLSFVTWRQKSWRHIAFPLFWTGENMFNVTMYIRDAPYRRLHLLGRGLIHDWHWLLNGDPDAAELLGGMMFGLAVFVCLAAIGLGIWSAVLGFRESRNDDDFDQPRISPSTTHHHSIHAS
jgi:hypothetical protein